VLLIGSAVAIDEVIADRRIPAAVNGPIVETPQGMAQFATARQRTSVERSISDLSASPPRAELSAEPGNSGGPLFDASGNVIGVVSAKLNAVKVAGMTGDIPENVNFALSVSVLRAFLDSRGVQYQTATLATELSAPDIGDAGKRITELVECWQ
jgi:S1-C subfamily serine protease